MTRTDVMASSRPRTRGEGRSNRRSGTVRALVALPIVLLMALALLAPGTAMAAEETSGYNQTPTTPTTSTPSTTPSTGTSPSKEEAPTSTTPSKETEPTKSTSPAKEAKTLPFTGFDLRWSFGIGLVLMGAGFSIVMMQRRRREGGR